MAAYNDETPESVACTFEGCSRTFGQSRADRYYSRRWADGWVSVNPGWRCPDHHAFEITFEEALDAVGAVWGSVDQEFVVGEQEQQSSDLDYEAVVRALERGRTNT